MNTHQEYEHVIYRTNDGVATLTLNRPERRNAISDAMLAEIDAVLSRVESADDVRVLVLGGSGGAFCAGADLSAARKEEHPLARVRRFNNVALKLHRLSKPTIAAVDGPAVGAGCNLALMCDLVLASDRSRFGEVFVARGLAVDFGGSWVLPRLVGLQKAKELCLTGDIISAGEACRIGMILAVVDADQLNDRVATLAARIACGPPIAQALIKQQLNAGASSSIDDALRAETVAQVVNQGSSDAREGFSAFREKRSPNFTGAWLQSDRPSGRLPMEGGGA